MRRKRPGDRARTSLTPGAASWCGGDRQARRPVRGSPSGSSRPPCVDRTSLGRGRGRPDRDLDLATVERSRNRPFRCRFVRRPPRPARWPVPAVRPVPSAATAAAQPALLGPSWQVITGAPIATGADSAKAGDAPPSARTHTALRHDRTSPCGEW